MKIETLAYNSAFEPPQHLKFADNVIVRVAGFIPGFVSLYHPYNAYILDALQRWLKVAKTVFIWDGYPDNDAWSMVPSYNYLANSLHIKELAQLGVTGYFAEGWPNPGHDMVDLRVFLGGRMAFDPSLDADKLLTEFTETYYGGGVASTNVEAYIKLMNASFATCNRSVDFAGRAMDSQFAGHTGPNSSAFSNDT
eukprot:COSAG03_NODE_8792_length_771_cov_1.154762_2_plen_194_part_01